MARLVLGGGEFGPTEFPVYVGDTLIGEVCRTHSKARGFWWWARPADMESDGVPTGPFFDFVDALEALTRGRIKVWE